jgi:hypothetical protein
MSAWQKRAILFVLALSIPASIAAYFLALQSEAYATACNFVRSDPKVTAGLGPVEACRLRPWNRWFITYNGSRGSAAFNLNAKGEKGSAIVHVALKWCPAEARWIVQHAELHLHSGVVLSLASDRGSGP